MPCLPFISQTTPLASHGLESFPRKIRCEPRAAVVPVARKIHAAPAKGRSRSAHSPFSTEGPKAPHQQWPVDSQPPLPPRLCPRDPPRREHRLLPLIAAAAAAVSALPAWVFPILSTRVSA